MFAVGITARTLPDYFEPINVVGYSFLFSIGLRSFYILNSDTVRSNNLLLGQSFEDAVVRLPVVLISVAALALGYVAARQIHVLPRLAERLSRRRLVPARVVPVASLLLFAGGVGIFLLVVALDVRFSTDIASLSRKRSIDFGGTVGAGGYYRLLVQLTPFAFFLLAFAMIARLVDRTPLMLAFAALILLAACTVPYLTSSRGSILIIGINCVVFAYYSRRLKIAYLLPMGVLAISLVFAMGQLRAVNQRGVAFYDSALDSLLGSGNGIDVFRTSAIMGAADAADVRLHGSSLGSLFVAPVPRSVWPEKPPASLGPWGEDGTVRRPGTNQRHAARADRRGLPELRRARQRRSVVRVRRAAARVLQLLRPLPRSLVLHDRTVLRDAVAPRLRHRRSEPLARSAADASADGHRHARAARRDHGRGVTASVRGVRAAGAFGLRLAGAAATLALTLYVTRTLEGEAAGLFFVGLSILMLSACLSRQGLDMALVRRLAVLDSPEEAPVRAGLYRHAVVRVLGAALVLALLLAGGAFMLAATGRIEETVRDTVFRVALALPPFALVTTHGFCFQGGGRVVAAIFFRQVFMASITVALCVLLGADSLARVLDCLVLSCLLSLAVAAAIWRSRAGRPVVAPDAAYRRALDRTLPTLLAIAMMNQSVQWISPLLIGLVADAESVALYAVAARLAMLIGFVYTASNFLVSHRLAKLHSRHDVDGIAVLIRLATRLSLLFGLPLFLAYVVLAKPLLSLFGEGYERAWPALLILSFGQLVNVATGSVAFLQQMSGNEGSHLRNMLCSSAILLLATPPIAYAYGWLGASVVTCVAVATQNLLGVCQVKRLFGIDMPRLVLGAPPGRRGGAEDGSS